MNARGRGLILELQFVVDAPRERIFRTLTEPAELARWWGPHGYTTPGIDLDLRVGGGYRFTMQPPGGDRFHLAGEFLEIEPPSRLAYTFRWEEPDPDDRETAVTLSLDHLGDATEVSLSQGEFRDRGAPGVAPERLDGQLGEAARADRVERLATDAPRRRPEPTASIATSPDSGISAPPHRTGNSVPTGTETGSYSAPLRVGDLREWVGCTAAWRSP